MTDETYNIARLLQEQEQGHKHEFLFFWGHTGRPGTVDKSCFSQWYESPFTVNGFMFPTAEHWMMAQKALLFHDKPVFEEIIATHSPKDVKALGRKVNGYNNEVWDAHKRRIVKEGNFHKFSQNPAFAEYLVNTGNTVIAEASPVDTIWGIGLTADAKNVKDVNSWRGENLLGFVLMEVRDALRH